MRIFFLAILIFCLAGCRDKDGIPVGILKRDKMQEVFWNIVRAEAFTNQFIKKNPAKNIQIENARLQQQIFADNDVTKDEFYKSYNFYLSHVELMRNLLDSITSRGERQKYTTLYNTPSVVTVKFSLMPLPAPAWPKIIPMPIPVKMQSVVFDMVPVIVPSIILPVNKVVKTIPLIHPKPSFKKANRLSKLIAP